MGLFWTRWRIVAVSYITDTTPEMTCVLERADNGKQRTRTVTGHWTLEQLTS